MNTKLYIGFLASSLLALAAVEGCGSDTTGTTGGSTSASSGDVASSSAGTGGDASTSASTTASGTGGGMPAPMPPKLGKQIDRMGRPAINTALNHTFDANDATKGMGKDAYNQESDPSKWGASFGPEISANLGILDSLDANCGNQLLAGAMPVAGRYATLAGALSDDRLYVNLDGAACTTYLAVEANATGLLTNMDCGGRKLDYDVIDTSYSALAAGVFAGVGDGVAADADTKGAVFPYLTAPH